MSVQDRERSSRGNTRKLKELLHKSDNRICADCGAPDPKWASANIGVFICVKCCGVHRSLGTHISKVLSVTLDEWSDEEIESMIEVGGNSYANSIYEAFLPENYPKPKPDSNSEERSKFIRSKYELQEFLKPSLRIVSTKSSYKSCDSGKDKDYSSDADNSAGMVEFIGILNTKVVKGTNLAVRDLRSSDPYVVLTLGHQKAQTTIKNSNLNPVWNEELKLSVPESYGPLKLGLDPAGVRRELLREPGGATNQSARYMRCNHKWMKHHSLRGTLGCVTMKRMERHSPKVSLGDAVIIG